MHTTELYLADYEKSVFNLRLQIAEKYWGDVPKGNLRLQADHAEGVWSKVTKDAEKRGQDVEYALMAYNGGGNPQQDSKIYANKVLKLLARLGDA